ncbi:MAG: glycosyltransferase [Ignavibacteria bacterium]|nr:glycosyltransferase [Ignavibacteria bacterium]
MTDFKKISEEKNYWRKKNKFYYQSLEKLFKNLLPENSSVLEIGCADGDTLQSLGNEKSAGIDYNCYHIENANAKYPGIRFYFIDIEASDFEEKAKEINEKFDVIILSDLIGTLKDIQTVFERIKTFSHERTKIVVTYHNYFWNPILRLGEALHLKMKEGEKNWLYIHEIKNLLYLAGFDVVRAGGILLMPLNIPLISSFVNKYFSKIPLVKRLCLVGYVVANNDTREVSEEKYKTTVLVPARNEEGNIENILTRIPDMGNGTEIIFVEGNSSDNTYGKIEEIIKQNPDKDIKLFKQPGKGKGDAVRKGFENATGDILMILDADMTVPPEDLPKFYNALASGKGEFINGSRLVYQMHEKAMRSLNKAGNIFFSNVFSWLLEQRITDTLCGTKVLFKKDYDKIVENRKYFGDFDPFGDFDLLFGASKLNLKIIEIPVRYGERTYGETNISRFRDGMMLLRMCFFAMRKLKFNQ